MTKGLSKLQRYILRTALESFGSVTNQQVMIGYYGFETAPGYQDRGLGKLAFDVQRIGPRRYYAAAVSVAKSFSRLAAEGLARRDQNQGIYLTADGRAIAKSICQMLKNVEAAPS